MHWLTSHSFGCGLFRLLPEPRLGVFEGTGRACPDTRVTNQPREPPFGVIAMRLRTALPAFCLTMFTVVTGCKQNTFLTEFDYEHYKNLMPAAVYELDPQASNQPVTARVVKPPTVVDPDRKPRYLSLAEAIAVGLEQGNVGSQSSGNAGIAFDNLVTFQGRVISGSDNIRVLQLDPAVAGSNIENALARFDAVWTSSMNWQNTDRPIGGPLDSFQASGSGVSAIKQADANFSTGVIKPLASGGVAGITFKTDYQYTNLPARVNPYYRPALQLQFEQPLLRDFGTEINQLRAAGPNSLISPGVLNATFAQDGILITRLRYDQSRAELERVVGYLLLNVETAYWNLYGAYWNLYAREQALRQGYEAWRISKARLDAGLITLADLAQTRGQFELFRGQRLAALDQVLENERQLRNLMGLTAEDGTRIIPIDAPTLARFEPDWETAYEEAIDLRPELHLARREVKVRQLELVNQRNNLLPDLRFISTYDVNAIGNDLDGPNADNALRNLATNGFNNWQLGLRLNVPIGFRVANANVRIAKLELARAYEILHDQELRVGRGLSQSYRRMFTGYEEIKVQRAQREAFGEQLRIRFQEFLAGKSSGGDRKRDTIDILLEAQRFWADALANEYSSIVKYNNAIANFEYSKGTLLKHNNVVISEGALPGVAQVRAVEHQRERSKALVLREHASPVKYEEFNPENGQVGLPALPDSSAPSLPALLKEAPEMPEMLPDPKAKPIGPEVGIGGGTPSLRGMLKFDEPGISISDTKPEEKGLPLPSGIAPMSGFPEVKPAIAPSTLGGPVSGQARPVGNTVSRFNPENKWNRNPAGDFPGEVREKGQPGEKASTSGRPMMVQPTKAKGLLEIPPE